MRYNTNQYNLDFKNTNTHDDSKVRMGIFFAGGGGISQGAKQVKEVEIVWLLNHDKTAIKTSAFHNKKAKVLWADVHVQDEHELDQVDTIQASIECDEHTDANTNPIKDKQAYMMGWELLRYLRYLKEASTIWIENVPGFKKWAPLDEDNRPIKERRGEEFERWKKAIMDLGYEYKESIRNAADDGMPTSRERFFCVFYRPGMDVDFPETTHSKTGKDGKPKHKPCRPYIDTNHIGESVFGRQFNENLPKHLRRPLVDNSLRRIAGGIKKQYPAVFRGLQFIAKYYNSAGNPESQTQSLDDPLSAVLGVAKHQLITMENGHFLVKYHGGKDDKTLERSQSLEVPLRTIDTSNRHQLITLEKIRFIMDHCHTDNYHSLDDPMKPILTRQTKQLTEVDFPWHLIVQYYGGSIQSNNLEEPLNTIPCRDTHQLIRLEKIQFIVKYFNSNGNPEYNTQSLDEPLSPVMTELKHQLITILDDFDIKARFLRPDELAGCSTFPRDYFSHPELKLSQKSAVQLIGNAVPPYWTELFLSHNIKAMLAYKEERMSA